MLPVSTSFRLRLTKERISQSGVFRAQFPRIYNLTATRILSFISRPTIRGINYGRAKGRPAGSREAQRIYISLINFFPIRLSSIYTPANRPRDPVEVISFIRISFDQVSSILFPYERNSFFSYHKKTISQINFIRYINMIRENLEFCYKIFARRSLPRRRQADPLRRH